MQSETQIREAGTSGKIGNYKRMKRREMRQGGEFPPKKPCFTLALGVFLTDLLTGVTTTVEADFNTDFRERGGVFIVVAVASTSSSSVAKFEGGRFSSFSSSTSSVEPPSFPTAEAPSFRSSL